PRAVGTDAGLDRDRGRGANRLAELARDAAFQPVRVAAKRVQAPEARRLRRLLLGIEHRRLAREEMLQRDAEPYEQVRHQKCLYGTQLASRPAKTARPAEAVGPDKTAAPARPAAPARTA